MPTTQASSTFYLDRTVSYRLHELKKLTDKQTELMYASELGISLPDARCISVLGTFGALTISELANRSNLARSQASRAAEQLIQKKLLTKHAHQADARSVIVSLSASGKKLFVRIVKIVAQRNDAMCACLSANEQLQLDKILDKLLASARQPLDLML